MHAVLAHVLYAVEPLNVPRYSLHVVPECKYGCLLELSVFQCSVWPSIVNFFASLCNVNIHLHLHVGLNYMYMYVCIYNVYTCTRVFLSVYPVLNQFMSLLEDKTSVEDFVEWAQTILDSSIKVYSTARDVEDIVLSGYKCMCTYCRTVFTVCFS